MTPTVLIKVRSVGPARDGPGSVERQQAGSGPRGGRLQRAQIRLHHAPYELLEAHQRTPSESLARLARIAHVGRTRVRLLRPNQAGVQAHVRLRVKAHARERG